MSKSLKLETLKGEESHPIKKFGSSLIGWHGRENAGDDAFFAVLCRWMLSELHVERIQVPGVYAKLPKQKFTIPIDIVGVELDRPRGRIASYFRETKHIFGKEFVIFGGGSIFSKRNFWWLTLQLWLMKTLCKLGICNTKVAGIGISIGPFSRLLDGFWCKRALRQFDLVMVRDEQSRKLGEDYGLANLIPSMDLALALPHYYDIPVRVKRRTPTSSPLIGISIVDRDTEFGSPKIDEIKRDAIVEALKGVAEVYPKARFLGMVFCKNRFAGDHVATEKLLEPLKQAGCEVELIEYENDPVALCGLIAQLDAMICNRMHSFVFSCLTQTPATMISYAPKMIEFSRSIQMPKEFLFHHEKLIAEDLTESLLKLIEQQSLPCDLEFLAQCGKQVLNDLQTAGRILRQRTG